MAISEGSLSAAIKTNVKACGFNVGGENECFIDAVSKAVVAEIKKGDVVVASGSSAGTYKIT